MKVRSYPVAPNAVYVWRGFMAPGSSYTQFAQFLGNIFVPACALLQPNAGLRAYLPTMVPQNGKPAMVPDQTALMFWATPAAHDQANAAIAVRIYQQLHGDVYDMVRSKLPEVPVALTSIGGPAPTLVADQPYYVFDQAADWMLGNTNHLVGAKRADLTTADFLSQAYTWAAALRAKPPLGMDAALVSCGPDYVTAWVHSTSKGAGFAKALDGLAALTTPVLRQNPVPFTPGAGLWDAWPGIDLTKNSCINIQLNRPPANRVTPGPPKKK
jgi:hypothetical protein